MTLPRGTAPPVSSRAASIPPFHVMALLARSQALAAQGRDIVHMEVGEPDFETAAPIVQAGRDALARGRTHYTPALGLPALREAISGWYRSRYGLSVAPERIVVTSGASGALILACALVADVGDELIMADPGYPCNASIAETLGATARRLPVLPEHGYHLTAEQLQASAGPATRAVLVASPGNPAGTVMPAAQLAALAACARSLKLWLISDEIYHGLEYGQAAHSALAFSDQALVVNSFSKYFGMTGWRLGWLVAPECAVAELDRLAQNLFIAAPTVAQHAALAAFLPETQQILQQRRDLFGARRTLLLDALSATPLQIPVVPDGAFYVYARLPDGAPDSLAFCEALLELTGVALTPGIDFGAHEAARHLRFAYTAPEERLLEGVGRLKQVLERYGG